MTKGRITIYLEGGGPKKGGRGKTGTNGRKMRNAMSKFLEPAWKKSSDSIKPDIVLCGGRGDAYNAFKRNFDGDSESMAILLVDSEESVHEQRSRKDHLQVSHGWAFGGIPEDSVHLMVQIMETWIVADPESMAEHFGRGFRANGLPKARDLETVSKSDIEAGISKAVSGTSAGRYHKVGDGAALLGKIKVNLVKTRCRHCAALCEIIERYAITR